MTLRAAVIGARRSRQGTGEWIARDLSRLGVEVAAIVGTSAESRAEAQATLRARYGIKAATYGSLPELLAHETVDVVAICSPPEAHLEQLLSAAQAGCHVFCEKPIAWWPNLPTQPEAQLRDQVESLLAAFTSRGLLLTLNCQWPFTLGAFYELHPGLRGVRVERFEMSLSPMRTGAAALVDSGSHPLSMLYTMLGASLEGVSDPRVSFAGADRSSMTCEFDYSHASGIVPVRILLEEHPAPPRPAGYSINGAPVNRRIQLPTYSLSFEAEGRSVALSDPLTAAVADFLARLRAGTPTETAPVLAGALHLHRLVKAARLAEETP